MGFGMLAYNWAWVLAIVLCIFIGIIWIPKHAEERPVAVALSRVRRLQEAKQLVHPSSYRLASLR